MPRGLRAGHPTHWVEQKGRGPKLVFAHCSLGHVGSWGAVLTKLADRHCVAFDLPDHGQTAPTPANTCPQRLSADILLDEMNRTEGPVHLIGHSFGGTAALLAALDAPANLTALTLIEPVQFCAAIGTQVHADHEADLAKYIQGWRANDLTKSAEGFMDVWGGGTKFCDLPDRQKTYIIDRIHIIAAQGPALNDDKNGILSAGYLENLQVPVTFIEGKNSPAIASAIIGYLENRIPNTSRHRLDDADHMLPITHAKDVAEIIARTP